MKKNLILGLLLLTYCIGFSQELSEEQLEKKIDSVHKTFSYQTGKITLKNGLAEIDVPKGYKFLDGKQSKVVLTDLWGNPPSDVLGMLFPENINPLSKDFTYALEISYSEEGYIKDDDAKELDYDDLLEQMQQDTEASNPERKKLNYPEIELVGWAQPPFYDQETKKLHWAKELKFEGDEINTLNYDIRILGRKGYLNLNAIGQIDILPLFKKDVNKVISSVHFTEGNKYSDFNPDMDEVAAYGIGGLIAGKLLAKAGFFALLLKFWKVIAVAVVGGFGIFKNKIFGNK